MIPFLDLYATNQPYRQEIDDAIADVLDRGCYVLGPNVEGFESNYARYCGCQYAIGVACGLDALSLIIRAYGFRGGDEIIVAANAYLACFLAISHNQCKPVPVEPDIHTYNIDPELIEAAITPKTKAIMAVHLYGQVCPMGAIQTIAQKYDLKVIEDASQAHGARLNETPAGHLGDASAFSCYPTKNLGCLGDGGVITTDDENLAEMIRAYRNYGYKSKNYADYQGVNSRLDELQAAVLNVKLKHLDQENRIRKKIAKHYLDNIRNDAIVLPECIDKDSHVWHLFVIRTVRRDELQKHLLERGIQTAIHYPIAPYKQTAYAEWNHLSYPVCEQIHNEVLSLPLNSAMNQCDIETVIEAVNCYEG